MIQRNPIPMRAIARNAQHTPLGTRPHASRREPDRVVAGLIAITVGRFVVWLILIGLLWPEHQCAMPVSSKIPSKKFLDTRHHRPSVAAPMGG